MGGMSVKRIKVIWRNAAYYVSEPNWDGGDVVMAEDYDALIAERDALRKDAERYRWLRECSAVRSDRWIYISKSIYENGVFRGSIDVSREQLDAAIDAAIKAQEAGEANVRT